MIGDADAGDDGYVTIAEMLEDDIVASPICPICKAKLESLGKPLHSKGQKYTFIYNCEKDGDMILTLKLHRNFNDTWRAKRTLDKATDEKLEAYKLGLEKSNIRRKSTKKNYRKRKKPQQPTEASEVSV